MAIFVHSSKYILLYLCMFFRLTAFQSFILFNPYESKPLFNTSYQSVYFFFHAPTYRGASVSWMCFKSRAKGNCRPHLGTSSSQTWTWTWLHVDLNLDLNNWSLQEIVLLNLHFSTNIPVICKYYKLFSKDVKQFHLTTPHALLGISQRNAKKEKK